MLSKMKQYTDESQTDYLIDKGFDKPSPKWVQDENGEYRVRVNNAGYDIWELLKLLSRFTIEIDNNTDEKSWVVSVPNYYVVCKELIDCLFILCLQLKKDGKL